MAVKVRVYPQDGMLRLGFTVAGQRRRWTLGLADSPAGRAKAQEIAARITLDLMTGSYKDDPAYYRTPPPTTLATRDRGMTALELWPRFMSHIKARGISKQRIQNHYVNLEHLFSDYGKLVSEAPETVGPFLEILRTRQSALTYNLNLVTLRCFGNWAMSEELWKSNPFLGYPRLKVVPKRRGAFTVEEVRRILEVAKDRVYGDFFCAAFYLGCRPSELIGLRWVNVDLSRAEVIICESLHREPQGAGFERRPTKTGTVRVLPIPPALLARLKERYRSATPEDLVFKNSLGQPIHIRTLREVWKRVIKDAGIPYRPLYTARHTCLSHAIEQTGSLAIAAAIAGHTNLTMVSRVYGHLIREVRLPRYENPE